MRLLELVLSVLVALVAMTARRLARGPCHPSWSWSTERAVVTLRTALRKARKWGMTDFRKVQGLIAPRPPKIPGMEFRETTVDGIPCEWCLPNGEPMPDRDVILFLHGGAYVFGAPSTYLPLVARVASQTERPVLSVDYRLGPEHKFPAAQEDCLNAYRWLVKQGWRPSQIVLLGDSAGGALCVATMLALRDDGERQPAGAALISPWVDPLAHGGSMQSNIKYDIFDRDFLVWCFEQYMGDHDPKDPRVSPLNADRRGLAPAYIVVGELEIFYDQIHAFCRKTMNDFEVNFYDGMYHDFPVAAPSDDMGESAIEDIAEFIRSRSPLNPMLGDNT